ncbi:MAG: hypothetical protein BJ554DRAFT_163 [Olpidium bornovanus]|uniref:Uncharacterized protein n=1 Tax=Olpidium bornovanus TaxID=278681 RepID=A0A8H7ZU01_9FUNG|nr:MAG: hypothetical protein BJ554DRAFT_163 [Olpidium bornovanus]
MRYVAELTPGQRTPPENGAVCLRVRLLLCSVRRPLRPLRPRRPPGAACVPPSLATGYRRRARPDPGRTREEIVLALTQFAVCDLLYAAGTRFNLGKKK